MSRVSIDTTLVHRAAGYVAGAQRTAGSAWTALADALALTNGMAGNPGKDRAAATFIPAYARAVQAAWQGFAALHRSVGDMSKGLDQTAGNHTRADLHSVIGDRFSVVPRQQGSFLDGLLTAEVSGPLAVPAPPSAAGPGVEAPRSLIGSLTGHEAFDLSEYWPTGDALKLAMAADGWQSASTALIAVRDLLSANAKIVTDQSDGPDIDAFGGYWKRLYSSGSPNTLLDGMPRLCTAIARGCREYSDAVNHGQLRMNSVAGNPVITVAELAALRAALITAAETLLRTVTVIAGSTLAGHLIASVTIGAANAPGVRILEAELDDSVLREWRNHGDGSPDPDELTSDPRRIAEELGYSENEINDAIHEVKARGDWRGYGDHKNPDVEIDMESGEVYPKTRNGVSEDSIGNIRDYLPKR